MMGSINIPSTISIHLCPRFCASYQSNTCFFIALASLLSIPIVEVKVLAFNSLLQCLSTNNEQFNHKLQTFFPKYKNYVEIPKLEIQQLLSSIDSSLMLVSLVVEAICISKAMSIKLYIWIDNISKTILFGDNNNAFLSLHVINSIHQTLYYVGKIAPSLKRKRVVWTIEEETHLSLIIAENKNLTNTKIATLFFSMPLCMHTIEAIRSKIQRIKAKQNVAIVHDTDKDPRVVYKSTKKDQYLKKIENTPSRPCSICKRLMFLKNYKKKRDREMDTTTFNCELCKEHNKKNKLSRFALLAMENLNTPIPIVDSLNHVEARLVSIRIPFAQIRQLSHNGQLGLRGTIINVMADVQRAQTVLPRFCHLESSVLVGIKRKLSYDHAYLAGSVRPLRTMCALRALMPTTLYLENSVALNVEWHDHIQSLQQSQLEEIIHEPASDSTDEEPPSDYLLHTLGPSQQIVDMNDSIHNVAPCENFHPLSVFKDIHCEELCFPTLFYGEKRKYSQMTKKDYQTTAKWELMHKDRRFAFNIENIFFKAVKIMLVKVLSSIWVRLRKGKIGSTLLTASNVCTDTNIENLLHSKIGYKDFQSVRTSPDYKEKLKSNLFAMIRQLGTPTFFVTFSSAERLWPPLITALEKLNPQKKTNEESPSSYVQRLLRSDPVTTVRYYTHRFECLKNLLTKDATILGGVEDYFFVTEFQTRGSQHDHGLLWIKDAPIIDKDDDNNIIRFIDTYIKTNKELLPEQLQLAQTHHHTKTCTKRSKVCRFGFPRPPIPQTMILRPNNERTVSKEQKKHIRTILRNNNPSELTFADWLLSNNITFPLYIAYLKTTIDTPTLFLQRTPSDIFTNNFNPNIAKLWYANTDIQFVLNAHGAASYCTSYMTKMDTTLTKALKQEFKACINDNSSTLDRLKRMGTTLLHTQQISSQQAIYICLSLPLSTSSRDHQFINTAEPSERTLLLKRRHILETMPSTSTDIFCSDIIQKYADRNISLQNVCLADFVSKYTMVRNNYRLRKNNKIIRYIKYNKEKDPHNYYREQCLLYLPFRNSEQEHLEDNETWHNVYNKHIVGITEKMKEYNKIYEELTTNSASENINSTWTRSTSVPFSANEQYDITLDIHAKPKKTQGVLPLQKTYVFQQNAYFFEQLQLMNQEQKLLYNDIMLKKRISPNTALNIFITGGAGTGKTFTLMLIIQGLLRYYAPSLQENIDSPLALIMAYTGKAAFNIAGTTIHSALHLPLITNTQTGLSSEKLNALSIQYRSLKFIVIDEISLVGANTFNLIDTRLRAIMHVPHKPFAGLDVILCGDLFQASPVRDRWLFAPKSNILEALSPTFWRSTLKYYELRETMRQKDSQFISVLNRIRIGAQTDQDIQYLNKTFCRPTIPPNIPHLFFTNFDKDKHNKAAYDSAPGLPHIFTCTDIRHKTCSKKIQVPQDAQSTAGLHHTISLKTNMTVELCAGNHNVQDGLVNGADGIFMATTIVENTKIVWIQFSIPETGSKTRYESFRLYTDNIHRSWTPIKPITKEFQIGKNNFNIITRKQFPIQPASARTIHRSQGLTMAALAFEPKNIRTHGLAYTALSRIKNPENLYLLSPITHAHIRVDNTVLDESNRIQNTQNYNPMQLHFQATDGNKMLIQSLNTVSLPKHHQNILLDTSILASDILCFQETRTQKNAPPILPSFQCLSTPTKHGAAIYYKETFQPYEWSFQDQYNVEILIAQFKTTNMETFKLMSVYSPPQTNITALMDALELSLHKQPTENSTPIICIGDFNVDAVRSTIAYRKLHTFFDKHNMKQHIQHPTTNHSSALDHIWTTQHYNSALFGTNYCYWSDHSIVYMKHTLPTNTNNHQAS